MSIYPGFKSTKTYNSSNIVGAEDGLTVVKLDLSSFVQKSAAVFDGDVYLKDNVSLNWNGVTQNSPYDDNEKTINNDNKNKLTNINYDGTATKVDGSLDLRGSELLITNETIAIDKITNLSSTLVGIQDNLNNIASNDAELLDLHAENISQEAKIVALEDLTSVHTVDIASNIANINSIDTDILNIQTNIVSVEADVTDNSTNITSNKALIDNNIVDITDIQTNIVTVESDIVTNLGIFNDYKDLTEAELLSLSNEIAANDTDIFDLQANIASIEIVNTAQTNDISALDTLTSTHSTEIANVEAVNETQTTDITNLEVLTASHTSTLTNLNGLTTSHATDIDGLQTQQATNNSNISTLQTDILTKQSNISSLNTLNAAYLGNGDITNNQLSALNDISVTQSIQTQLNTLTSSLGVLDNLQDIDLVNIPLMQTDITDIQAQNVIDEAQILANSNMITTKHDVIDINNKLASSLLTRDDNLQYCDVASSINTSLTNLQTSTNTNNTAIISLINSDTLHDTQLSTLSGQDSILQANIDLKQNIISLVSQLNTTKIYDTNLNDSLNNILDTIDTNINTMNLNKQNKITSTAKLDSSLLDLTTTSLQYVDITSNLKVQLTNITNAISTLQGLQNNDITSFQTIEDNFDTLALQKLNQSVYDVTIAPQITSILSSISTLQGLQDGDIVSFASINSSITNLTNTKQPIIDVNNKLNSSLINRDDSLQYVDISTSLATSLTTLQTNIDNAQGTVYDINNKLDSSFLNRDDNLQYFDINTSLTSQLSTINTSITNLNNYDTAQTILNGGYTTDINTLNTFKDSQTIINDSISLITANQSLKWSDSTTNLFSLLDLSTRLLPENAETDMLFTKSDSNPIFDGNYRFSQSSYFGDYTGDTQLNTSYSMSNLFVDGSEFRQSFLNSRFYDTSRAEIVKYMELVHYSTGVYKGGATTYDPTYKPVYITSTNSNFNLKGEYIEIEFPYYIQLTQFIIGSPSPHYIPSKFYVLGKYDDTSEFEIIKSIVCYNLSELIEPVTTLSKYKIFRIVFGQLNDYTGLILNNLEFYGDIYQPTDTTTDVNEMVNFKADQLIINTNVDLSIVDLQTYDTAQTIINDNQTLINNDQTTINTTLSNYNTAQDILNTTLTDYNTAQDIQNTTLSDYNTAQDILNTTYTDYNTAQDILNTTFTDYNTAQNILNTTYADYNTAQTIINNDQTTINTTYASYHTNQDIINTSQLTINSNLQTNIDNVKTKTENITSGSFNTNILTYTYNEENIFMNQLTENNVFELDLTIDTPVNNKNYVQKVIIDALQYKGYVNTLKINNEVVEIKYLDGDLGINLAPIAGYSMIMQDLQLTRYNDVWYCMSKLQLYYNSVSNNTYDVTAPILLIGNTIEYVAVGSTYVDAGFISAIDNVDGDVSSNVVVVSDVNDAVIGAYSVTFSVSDTNGNETIVIRSVIVEDQTVPVLTLTGNAEVTVNANEVYTELGATYTDNIDNNLTVIITGTVDTSIVNDYIVSYSVTDSNGNEAVVLNRLVHVVASPLKWSNPSFDILGASLIDLYNHFSYFTTAETKNTVTISGEAMSFKNGIYTLTECNHHTSSNTYDGKNIFQSTSTWSAQDFHAGNAYNSEEYGVVTPPMTRSAYAGVYRGHNDSLGKVIYYSETCNAVNYDGLYHKLTFPFQIEISAFEVVYKGTGETLTFALLGSNDEINYEYIGSHDNLTTGIASTKINVSTTLKYNCFKMVYTSCSWTNNNIAVKQIKLYGDIYQY